MTKNCSWETDHAKAPVAAAPYQSPSHGTKKGEMMESPSQEKKPRSKKPCPLCVLPWRAAFDRFLEQGHSYLCLYWEFRRRGLCFFPQTIATHHQKHTSHFTLPTPQPEIASPWWYVAPYPDPTLPTIPPEIVLVRGLPGTGKTHFASFFETTHRHLEADHFFFTARGQYRYDKHLRQEAYLWCLASASGTLARQIPIVIANTFLTAAALDDYHALAAQYDVPLRIFTLPDTLPRTLKEAQATNNGVFRRINISLVGTMRKQWRTLSVAPDATSITIEDVPESYIRLPNALWITEKARNTLSYSCPPGLCVHAGRFAFQTMAEALRKEALERYPSTAQKAGRTIPHFLWK